MSDKRIIELAEKLISDSCELKENQNLLIKSHLICKPLIKELIKYANEKGINTFVEILDDELNSLSMLNSNKNRFENLLKWNMTKYTDIDAFISIYGIENDYESNDVHKDTKIMASKILKPLSELIVNTKKWVILEYPTFTGAFKAKMSYEKYSSFIFDTCLFDYKKLGDDLKPLKQLMDKTDNVKIIGPGTNLSFSIKNIPSVICAGENNIPDGEIFTAPVKTSINGEILFNTPSYYQGYVFNNIKLKFKDGKIIDYSCDEGSNQIENIINVDDGAKYIGEFAIGVNPKILSPIGNTLFDEKIYGSIHLTPGQCYDDASNDNNSAIHWDIIQIQTKKYGDYMIYFDDILIRKNGVFTLKELNNLNYLK